MSDDSPLLPSEPESPTTLGDLLANPSPLSAPIAAVDEPASDGEGLKRKRKPKPAAPNLSLYARVIFVAALTTLVVALAVLLLTPLREVRVVVTPTLPAPQPTSTPLPSGATPNALFNSNIGMSGYPLITKEQIDAVPAGSRVRAGSAWYDGIEWRYYITMVDEQTFAEARESQLDYAPGITPGAPTPTAAFWGGMGMGFTLLTNEPVGAIPANTLVAISAARLGLDGWLYTIVMRDGETTAEVDESKLRYAPGVTPGAPTPTARFMG